MDDFALSGTEIKQAAIKLRGGLGKYQATDEVVGLTICSPSKKHPRVESIYKPPSKSANQTGIAVAGSWSSTDYGYTDVLSRFNRLLATNSGMDRIRNMGVPPPSHQIKGRYDRGPDGQYLDPQYAEEYEQVKQAFGPHN